MNDSSFRRLERIHNFRDFGGYGAADGTTVKRGVLWRGGHQCDASASDLAVLDALGIELVVDLRGVKERAKYPSRRPRSFAGEVIEYDGETAGLAPHIEAAGHALDEQAAREVMVGLYADLPDRAGLNAVIPRYMQALAQGAGASFVHCAAGKDRTGIACDLVLHALGVHPDDRMEDYLLTNHAPDNERRIEEGLSSIAKHYPVTSEAAGRVLMGVEAAFLEAARASLVEAEGSIDAYLARRWGVDEAVKHKMREHLTE